MNPHNIKDIMTPADRQTTKFKVGDLVCEYDFYNGEKLDILFILNADIGNESSDDPEEYTSYYTFYSLEEEDVWEHESLDNGKIVHYEKFDT